MGLSLTGCSETNESTVHANDWYQSGREAVIAAQNVQPIDRRAKNVIFFIGDGMGVSTQTAARILEGQQLGVNGEAHQLSFERFPYT
ncbi:MAG: alkaline phosphatase, partial [Gammaproteobacteria bacterium]|nr:alkaline phosphatase [Gammaproteobacteria bacterium]